MPCNLFGFRATAHLGYMSLDTCGDRYATAELPKQQRPRRGGASAWRVNPFVSDPLASDPLAESWERF